MKNITINDTIHPLYILDESAISENEGTSDEENFENENDQEDEIKEDLTEDEKNKEAFTDNETNTLDVEQTEDDGKHF